MAYSIHKQTDQAIHLIITMKYIENEKERFIRSQKPRNRKKKEAQIVSPTINNSWRNSEQNVTKFYDNSDHISKSLSRLWFLRFVFMDC